jgi:hypothetical protein
LEALPLTQKCVLKYDNDSTKAKYTKVFKIVRHNDIEEDILKYFDNNGYYKYKDAQKNNHYLIYLNDYFFAHLYTYNIRCYQSILIYHLQYHCDGLF